MKKTIIALSAVLLASPVFAATTHATDDTVAAANANANEAKQKLHEEQNKGEELKLKQQHAAEGKSESLGSKVSSKVLNLANSSSQGKCNNLLACKLLRAPPHPLHPRSTRLQGCGKLRSKSRKPIRLLRK